MKRKMLFSAIVVLAICQLAAAASWIGVSTDPNELLQWEDPNHWYNETVPDAANPALIEVSPNNIAPTVPGIYPAYAYLNSTAEALYTNISNTTNHPGKLHIGPNGVLNTGSLTGATNGDASVITYGTVVSEGTIDVSGSVAFARKGDAFWDLRNGSLLTMDARSYFGQYAVNSAQRCDVLMTGNAAIRSNGDGLRNQVLEHEQFTLAMFDDSSLLHAPASTGASTYFDSFGTTSLNDNATMEWRCRFGTSGSKTGTLDINDNAQALFTGSHCDLYGTTVNVNGGTLEVGGDSIYGMRHCPEMNITGGRVACTVTKYAEGNTIYLSGTGEITGFSDIKSGPFYMTGGKLGCTVIPTNTPLNCENGVLAPGIEDVASMTISCDFIQTDPNGNAGLEVDIAGPSSSDSVTISGDASIAGALKVTVAPGAEIVPSDIFVVLTTTGTLTGEYSNAPHSSIIETEDGKYSCRVIYTANSLSLSEFGPLPCNGVEIPGDINGDCVVNMTDFAFLADGWFTISLPTYENADLGIMAANWLEFENTAPSVNAWAWPVITLPANQVAVKASIDDDGLGASISQMDASWAQTSGPAGVTFANAAAVSTTATFPGAGTYELTLTIDDGVYSDSDTVKVTVKPEPANIAPWVDAGTQQQVWMPDLDAQLNGSIEDDGKPAAAAVTYTWSKVQGPGTVTFTPSVNAEDPVATFSQAGDYILKLTASDTSLERSDRVWIRVNAAGTNMYGYTQAELENNFSFDMGIEYDYEGLAVDRFKAPPAPYVHPRILFNAEDLPDIRNRLDNTELGQYVMGRIRQRMIDELTSGSASTYGTIYDDLAAGDASSFSASEVQDGIACRMTYEAFRCLIDDDAVGGAKMGAALATLAAKIHTDILGVMPTTHYRHDVQGLVHRQNLGLQYDFVYNWMTDPQRATVRNMISLATTNMWTEGMDALPSLSANTSNWVPTHVMHLIFLNLAIEGETGYDELCYLRCVGSYERFLMLGVYPEDGFAWEGMGKNAVHTQALIPMAKRGDMLIAATAAKNHVKKYYAYSMLPWGDRFTMDEAWGGTGCDGKYTDIAGIKYAYPDDPVIDFMHRNDLHDDFSRIFDFNIRFTFKAQDYLHFAIFAEDWDRDLTWREGSEVLFDQPLTIFANQRGRMVSRSDWSDQALQLHFQPRSSEGGHSHYDRNSISLNALGRNWMPDWVTSTSVESIYHSVMLVDGEGPNNLPAKVITYEDTADASFMVGDAYYPYAKATSSAGGETTKPYSYFRLIRDDNLPWIDMPGAQLPDWMYSNKKSPTYYASRMSTEYVYRTTGLIRGDMPYVLMVDDMEMDDSNHTYESRFQLAMDLAGNVTIDGNQAIIADPVTGRRLLVLLFDYNGTPTITEGSESYTYGTTSIFPNLKITTNAESANFKTIIMPFTEGDDLPDFSFDGTTLTVASGYAIDRFTFTKDPSGRTLINMTRNNSEVVNVD